MQKIQSTDYQMKLGGFEFSIQAASFEQLNYVTNYRWQPSDTSSSDKSSRMQFRGTDNRTIEIKGTIFPQLVANGLGQLDLMRKEASKGKPLTMCYIETTDGYRGNVGRILGEWCITKISEDRTLFLANGTPREINFTMSLTSYT